MDASFYPLIKALHVCTAMLSISGFLYRGVLKLNHPARAIPKWLKIFPHFNDTLLLSCAIYLAAISQQWPTTTDWVAAKVIALLIYIGVGMVVLRFGKTQKQRIIAFGLAILSFSYIVLTALTRNPLIFS